MDSREARATTMHDQCSELLETALSTDHIGVHAENRVQQALDWHKNQNNSASELSLIEWLTVLRVVGNDISLQLDTGDEYIYLQFEPERNKTVVNNPQTETSTPIEQANTTDIFSTAEKRLWPSDKITAKTYNAVTAVVTQASDAQVVYGEYNKPFRITQSERNGAETSVASEQWVQPKTTFELPHEMTATEIDDWLTSQSEAVETITQIIQSNQAENWGGKTTPSSQQPHPRRSH